MMRKTLKKGLAQDLITEAEFLQASNWYEFIQEHERRSFTSFMKQWPLSKLRSIWLRAVGEKSVRVEYTRACYTFAICYYAFNTYSKPKRLEMPSGPRVEYTLIKDQVKRGNFA